MAYETGFYTDPADLLSKFRAFITSNGWSENGWASDGTGDRLHIQKGSLYFNLRSATAESSIFSNHGGNFTGIGINGSTGYSAGANWDQQPGSVNSGAGSGGFNANVKTSSATYHFFAQTDSITMFMECDDQYRQMTFGQTTRGYPVYIASGSGRHVIGQYYMQFGDEGYSSVLYDGVWTYGGTVDRDLNMPLYNQALITYKTLQRAKLQFRGNTLLLPSHMFRTGGTAATSLPYNYVGEIAGVKVLNAFNKVDGDPVVYAGDNYVISIVDSYGSDGFGVAALK